MIFFERFIRRRLVHALKELNTVHRLRGLCFLMVSMRRIMKKDQAVTKIIKHYTSCDMLAFVSHFSNE